MESKPLPSLRFPEFLGDWELHELGEFVDERKDIASSDLPLYSLTIESGIVPKSKRYERSFLVKSEVGAYKRMKPKDFAYNPMNLRWGALACHHGEEEIAVSKYYDVFSVNEKSVPEYLEPFLTSYKMVQFYDRMSEGTLEEKKRVHYLDFIHFKKLFPTLPEQRKIADFLTAVDGRIRQLIKKRALLEDYKKGVMQQIFTQAIRFQDDDGNNFPDWEEKTIGDFLTAYRGGAALKPADFCTTGQHLVFPKKYVVPGGKLLPDRESTYCTEEFFQNNTASIIDSTYLITTLRDLVPSGPSIGYIVEYDNNELYMLAQGVYGLQIDESELDKRFLIQFSNTSTYRRWMRKIKVGSTQVHIRVGDFKGVEIGVPTLPEQRKIADFLSAIDRKIESVATQITETQTFKRGLLQQMFV